jgi:uncharacterized metal-binding protein
MADEMKCSCAGGDKSRMIFPCSGQANTGQIANQAAIQLSDEDYGVFACTALLASGSESLAKRTHEIDEVVVIDGCKMACAKKIVEQVGGPVHQHLVVTEIGFEKTGSDRSFTPDQVEVIVSAAWKGEGKIVDSESENKSPSSGCGCGCNGTC